jgi:hypothetical protein
MNFGRCRSWRQVSVVRGCARAMYTSGQTLEKHLKTATNGHSSSRLAQSKPVGARSSSRVLRGRSELSCPRVAHQGTTWPRHPKTATSADRGCSLSDSSVKAAVSGEYAEGDMPLGPGVTQHCHEVQIMLISVSTGERTRTVDLRIMRRPWVTVRKPRKPCHRSQFYAIPAALQSLSTDCEKTRRIAVVTTGNPVVSR